MSKQDRQGVRTATDLERKYQFGKSFAEVMGIATNAKEAAEEAKQTVDTKLTHEEIFNLLTKNGALQGLYRGDDGELYINASYILSGEINADLIKAGTLRADEVKLDSGEDLLGYQFDTESALNSFIDSEAASMAVFAQKAIMARFGFGALNGAVGVVTISRVLTGSGIGVYAHILTHQEHLGRFSMDGMGSAWFSINAPSERTSGIWKVRTWGNGECELWGTVEATANLLSWGNVYFAEDVISAQTYPVTFANPPTVVATPQMKNEYVYGLLSGTVAGTTTASPSFCVWRANAASASIPVRVDLYIKGTLA